MKEAEYLAEVARAAKEALKMRYEGDLITALKKDVHTYWKEQLDIAIKENNEYHRLPEFKQGLLANIVTLSNISLDKSLSEIKVFSREDQAQAHRAWKRAQRLAILSQWKKLSPRQYQFAVMNSKNVYSRYVYWVKIFLGLPIIRRNKKGKEKIKDTTGLYEKTMYARLAIEPRAPFWYWLEYGAQHRYSFPKSPPTHFIAKTRLYAKELLRSALEMYDIQLRPNYLLEDLEKNNEEFRAWASSLGAAKKSIYITTRGRRVVRAHGARGRFLPGAFVPD